MKGKSNNYSMYDRGKMGLVCGGHKSRPQNPLSAKPRKSTQDYYDAIKRRADEYEDDYWRNKYGHGL